MRWNRRCTQINADKKRSFSSAFIRVHLRFVESLIGGIMRIAVAMIGLMVVGSGCTRFSGEWLEEGTVKRDGTFVPVDSERRTAMRFDWPATIRFGSYSDAAGVV